MMMPNLGLVIMLLSVAELHAVRDGRLEAVIGHKGPIDESFNKLFAQGANPCGGRFLPALKEPKGDTVVSHAWQSIDKPIRDYLSEKEQMIKDMEAKIEQTMMKIQNHEKKTATRVSPPEGRIREMISSMCTKEFGYQTGMDGLEACNEIGCGLWFDDGSDEMYEQEQEEPPRFVENFHKTNEEELKKYKFAPIFKQKCDELLPQPAESPDDPYNFGSSWCGRLCNLLQAKVNGDADDSGSASAIQLQKTLNALNEQLRDQNEQLTKHKQEHAQCEDARKSVGEFIKTMEEMSKDYDDRMKSRQVIQYKYMKARRRFDGAKKEMDEAAIKSDEITKEWQEKDEKMREIQAEMEAVAEREQEFIAEIVEQERLIAEAKDDLDALQDASNKVAEFKSALSLILLKISILYDSVINNPLRRLIVDETYLRETFVDPNLVVTGQTGDKTLLMEVKEALLDIKESCQTTVLVGVETIQLRGGRLILPSEAQNMNTSANNPELKKLLDDMPMGIDDIDLPNDFLPPIEKRNPRVRLGLRDMCESPEVSADEKTVEQVLEVINKRRDHLIEAFIKILSIANQEVLISTEHHHHPGDGHHHEHGFDEEEYECEHEPKGTAKFAAIFGEINFYKQFVSMWAHMDKGSGLAYFMRLEAMLEYLFLVANSKSKDHVLDLDRLNKEKDEISKALEQLIADVEAARNDANASADKKKELDAVLEKAKKNHEVTKKAHDDLLQSLDEANKKVNDAMQQAKDSHQAALDGVGRSSLLSMVMKQIHKTRRNKKAQIKSNAMEKVAKKEEVGLYGNDAMAWQKEARELEIELERLKKGAVYIPFMKQ